MSRTYTCFLHKPGVLAPERRVVSCPSRADLPDAIVAELRAWPAFELIEVYSEANEPIFRLARDERPPN